MLKKLSITLVIFLFVGAIAFAQVQIEVSKRDGIRAKQLIEFSGDKIRNFCEPCGDKFWQEITIETIDTKKSEENWQLTVNGEPIDLASTYIKTQDKWENLAMLLDLEASDSPQYLDESKAPETSEIPKEEILNQSSRHYIDVDAALNEAYNQLMAELSEFRGNLLRQAQREWIKFRDKSVEFEKSLEDTETDAQIREVVTLINLTDARTKILELELNPDEKEVSYCFTRKSMGSAKECIEELYQEADAELNEVYQELKKNLAEENGEKLKAAEIAWIKFRDACAEYAASKYEENPEMKEIVYTDELRIRTEERVEELKRILSLLEK